MAQRSPHFCSHPGCNVLTTDTYCLDHAPLHERRDDNRANSAERGYDSRWSKARARYLNRHPLCERCDRQGRVTIASVVHHVIPLEDGGARLDPNNFMALCRSCHEIIHGRKLERAG